MRTVTKAKLRALGIVSPYDIALCVGGLKPFVDYVPQNSGRAAHSAKWQVIRVGYKTDHEARWSNNGNKIFNVYRPSEDKAQVLQETLSWAGARYSITEWERSPFGSYHPKGTLEAAIAAAKAK